MAISFILATSLIPVVPAIAVSSDDEIDSKAEEASFDDSASGNIDSVVEGALEASSSVDAVIDEALEENGASAEALNSNEMPDAELEASSAVEPSGLVYSADSSNSEFIATCDAVSAAPGTFTDEYGTWTLMITSTGAIWVSQATISSDVVFDVFEFPTVVPCDVQMADGRTISKGTPIAKYNKLNKVTGIHAKEIVFPSTVQYMQPLTATCETVTIKSGVTGVTNLTKLTGVETLNVESGANVPSLAGSTTLKNINIDSGAKISANGLFKDCTALEEAKVHALTTQMFSGCTKLKTVELSDAVTVIPNNAFENCSELSSIDLSNIVSIGSCSFKKTGLSDISIPTNCTVSDKAFDSIESPLTVYYDGSALDRSAFSSDVLNELRLGPNASGINHSAFYGAVIYRLYIDPANTTCYSTNRENLFVRSDNGDDQVYPYQQIEQVVDTVRAVPASTTEWTVGKDIKYILSGSFNTHPRLTSISIEEGNTSFVLDSQGALYTADMKRLIKVPADTISFVVPDGVTMIDQNAFCRCDKLVSVTLPETLTEIRSEAFWGCSSLVSIKFPKSLTTVGVGILEGTAIEKLTMSEGLWSNSTKDDFVQDGAVPSISTLFYGMNWSAINWNTDLLNKSVTSLDLGLYRPSFIPAYAFAGLLGLTEVSIPSSVTSIGYGAFYFCLNLKDVYVYAPTGMKIETGGMSDGNSGSGNADESYKVSNPGSFSTWDDTLTPAPFTSAKYADLTGINFYGAAYSQNDVISYCAEHGQNFIPIAVLQDNNSVFGDYTVSYGTGAYDYNHVEIANIPVGGTPSVNVVFGDYGTPRTLSNGDGCSIYYVDSEGNVVTSFDKAGTYTAFISGDNKSVFGQRAVSFQVGDAVVQPVQPTQPVQPVQSTQLVQQTTAPATNQTFATTNDATDVAPVAAVGFAGALAAVGAWFARRRLRDKQ